MEEIDLDNIAVLIGEPVRARILWALLDGKAYTASELSLLSDTSPQNASMHLAKLTKGELLRVSSQGRHRYYSFARDEVAYAIEALANLAPPPSTKAIGAKEKTSPIKQCRTCYDHLAGKVGVLINENLLSKGCLIEADDSYKLTDTGQLWFANLEIDTAILLKQRRVLAKPCLDWSERRYHLAGSLGAALLGKMLGSDWIRRVENSRAVVITRKGQQQLYQLLGIEI